MGYAAEILGISYSQQDYQMVNISGTLNCLTWHGFDEFGWNDPDLSNLSSRERSEQLFQYVDCSCRIGLGSLKNCV